jgi:hypothetical protein
MDSKEEARMDVLWAWTQVAYMVVWKGDSSGVVSAIL